MMARHGIPSDCQGERGGRGRGGCDEGSGTLAGVALIAMTAVLAGVIASGGALLIAMAKARGVADVAAVSAAQTLMDGRDAPCDAADLVAAEQGADVESCTVEGEDVQVMIRLPTGVPIVSWVERESRSGPVRCDFP